MVFQSLDWGIVYVRNHGKNSLVRVVPYVLPKKGQIISVVCIGMEIFFSLVQSCFASHRSWVWFETSG